jgi:DNA mismatch endonuclease (patch repair protein)
MSGVKASGGRTVALGGGVVVPYPEPTDASATRVATGNKRKDTTAEVRLRSALHRRGLRYRKDRLVRLDGLNVRPDIVFTRAKVAVFMDGCFWHGCPEHGTVPTRNTEYWIPKLRANTKRDQRVNAALTAAGWEVQRVWEHEQQDEAAARIETVVRGR